VSRCVHILFAVFFCTCSCRNGSQYLRNGVTNGYGIWNP
jgi:hypothetical protein